MSVPRLFENLKMDRWFKAVTYLGGVIVVLAVFIPTQVLSNELIATFGAGMFLLGLGRWKNTKHFAGVQDMGLRGMFKVSGEHRNPDIVGLLMELSGWLLLIYAASVAAGVTRSSIPFLHL